MKTLHLKGKVIRFTCLFYLAFLLSTSTFAMTIPFESNSVPIKLNKAIEIGPRADQIEWRYKAIDGVLYKRKYNATRGIWIGDWIPA